MNDALNRCCFHLNDYDNDDDDVTDVRTVHFDVVWHSDDIVHDVCASRSNLDAADRFRVSSGSTFVSDDDSYACFDAAAAANEMVDSIENFYDDHRCRHSQSILFCVDLIRCHYDKTVADDVVDDDYDETMTMVYDVIVDSID